MSVQLSLCYSKIVNYLLIMYILDSIKEKERRKGRKEGIRIK